MSEIRFRTLAGSGLLTLVLGCSLAAGPADAAGSLAEDPCQIVDNSGIEALGRVAVGDIELEKTREGTSEFPDSTCRGSQNSVLVVHHGTSSPAYARQKQGSLRRGVSPGLDSLSGDIYTVDIPLGGTSFIMVRRISSIQGFYDCEAAAQKGNAVLEVQVYGARKNCMAVVTTMLKQGYRQL